MRSLDLVRRTMWGLAWALLAAVGGSAAYAWDASAYRKPSEAELKAKLGRKAA